MRAQNSIPGAAAPPQAAPAYPRPSPKQAPQQQHAAPTWESETIVLPRSGSSNRSSTREYTPSSQLLRGHKQTSFYSCQPFSGRKLRGQGGSPGGRVGRERRSQGSGSARGRLRAVGWAARCG